MAPETPHEPHEEPKVRTRRVAMLGLGFVAFALLLGGVLSIVYRIETRGEKLAMSLAAFPAPQLQPNPTRDWANFHAAQVEALEGYRWIDTSKGLVHVPIEAAMALVAARGPKAYDPVEGTPPFAAAASLDGAPRAKPQANVAPYGEVR